MATSSPFPLLAPISTELRMAHFDEQIYTGTPDTLLYKYVDAICGTTGAGSLLNQSFIARLTNALETIYFNDLDYIFSKTNFLSRSPAESYPYNPMTQMLTSDQWNEVKVKDAWFRARIKDFFVACSFGGTPKGIRMCVQAAVGSDCTLLETWRYVDNYGMGTNLGRSAFAARNEVTIRPRKKSLSPAEFRLLRDMLSRMSPIDTIITINVNGLSMLAPVAVSSATASSTYYEVQKSIVATPVIKTVTSTDLNINDLDSSHLWLFDATSEAQLAPYAAFNITSEYGYYYLMGSGDRSPIDSVTYGTLQPDGSVRSEPNFEVFQSTGSYTDWITYEKADSPDNYPGGKYGITPLKTPALNPDRSVYDFPWASQDAYITDKIQQVQTLGGIADKLHYKLPLKAAANPKTTYWPGYAIAYSAPSQESTVSTSLTAQRPNTLAGDWVNPATFVRTR
jgi:hypothetical protein